MSNTFKVGDKVTVNLNLGMREANCSRDTTQGKSYTLIAVDTPECNEGKHDVQFIDDVGDTAGRSHTGVTIVKE